MTNTMPTVKLLPGTKIVSSPFTSFKASTADDTESGGVIMPSANNNAAPKMAGI